MKVFKIRHKETGLFSTGGLSPTWSKQGKVWQRLSYVHNHISMFVESYRPNSVYKDAEVVEAEITEILHPIEPVSKYLLERIEVRIRYYEDLVKKRPDEGVYARLLEEWKARKELVR